MPHGFCSSSFFSLLGCILTHQLPFQRYIATYFCCIDVVITIQYIYYSRMDRLTEPPPAPTPFVRSPRSKSLSMTRSVERRYRSGSVGGSRQRRHYRTLSDVASNVALAASDLSDFRLTMPATIAGSPSVDNPLAHREHEPVVDPDHPPPLPPLTSAVPGSSTLRRNISWGPMDNIASILSPMTTLTTDLPAEGEARVDDRGRSRSRAGDSLMSEDQVRSLTGPRAKSAGASRRGASIVFLGVWAFFGVGKFMGRGLTGGNEVAGVGVVLDGSSANVPVAAVSPAPIPSLSAGSTVTPLVNLTFPRTVDEDDDPLPVPPPPPEHPSTERIIGRISAWTCAVLYLTSRLPQIWKNVSRTLIKRIPSLISDLVC